MPQVKLTKAQKEIVKALMDNEPLFNLPGRRVAVDKLVEAKIVRRISVNWYPSLGNDGKLVKTPLPTRHMEGYKETYLELTPEGRYMFKGKFN